MWDLDRVRALLMHRPGLLFVAGCVPDRGALHHGFDAVVLFSAPVDVILARAPKGTILRVDDEGSRQDR